MSAEPGPPGAEVLAEVAARAIAEDLGALGDVTSLALVDAAATGTARFVARAGGVLAGTGAAAAVFAALEPAVTVTWLRTDGDRIGAGTVLGTVAGPLRTILAGERSALNLLGHLSGVATLTGRFVDAAGAGRPGCAVRDTRKTTPGLRAAEKAAVRAGGGVNHRSGLSDAVLIKDNHLRHRSVTDALSAVRARWPALPVEVECDTLDQVAEAAAAGPDLVLLDNMSPDDVARAVALLRPPDGVSGDGTGGRRIPVEVSGGVTLETAAAYAAAGADFISVGALTHSAPVLDIGLDLD